MSARGGGGGGGRNLSILFSILGIDEAKAKVEGLAPSFDKLVAAAKKSGDAITKSLPDASKLSPVAAGVDKVKSSMDGLTTSSTKVSGEMSKLKTSADQVGTSTTKASGEFTKLKTSTDGISQSTTKAAADLDKLKTSEEGLATSSTKASTETGKLKQSQDQLAGTGQKVAGELTKESKSMADVATNSGKAATEAKKLKTETQGLATETNKVEKEMKETKNEIKQMGDESKKAGENVKKAGEEIDKTNQKTKETTANTTSLKASFSSLAGSVTSLGGGLVSLWQTYDSLGDAQLKVDQATVKLNANNVALQRAQETLNKLVEKGETNSAAYKIALDNVQIAQDRIAVATGKLQNAQEDLNVTQANFAMQIIPQVITVMGSMATILTTASTAMATFKKNTAETTIQVGFMDKAMKFMSLSNPFFLALTIGGSILAAFVTNLGGFRDMINGVGVALGNALGPLKPFLTMLGDLGNGLADFLSGGSQDMSAFAQETEDSMDTAGQAITGLTQNTNKTAGDLKKFGLDVGQVFVDSNGVVQGYKFDFGEAMDAIGKSSEAIPNQLKTNVNTATTYMSKLLQDAIKTADSLDKVFSRTVALGDVKLSGISGISNLKEEPKGLGEQLQSQRGKQGASPALVDTAKIKEVTAAMTELNKVHTFYEAETGKVYYNVKELEKAYTDGKISYDAYQAVINKVIPALNGVAISTSTNVSGSEQLRAEIQAQLPLIEDTATANDKLAGSMDKTTDSTSKTDTAFKNIVDKYGNLVVSASAVEGANTRMTSQLESTNAEMQYYTAVLSDAELANQLLVLGSAKQDLALKQQQATLLETVAGLNKYNEQLGTTEGAMTAVASGMAKQLDVFVKNKVAMFENIGVLGELNKEFASGEPQVTAYATAFYQAFIDMTNSQIAISGLRGEIAALEKMIETGEAQMTAFAETFLETKKAVLLSQTAINSLAAEVTVLARSWKEFDRTHTNVAKGVLDAEKAFLDFADEVEHTVGETTRYISLVKSGAISQGEWNKSFWEAKKSIADVKVEIHKAMAEYTVFSESIKNTAEQTDRANLAFMNGKRSIQDWYMEASTANDNIAGMYDELKLLAVPLGGIPPLIDGNIEAMKNWIAIQKGFPEAVEQGLAKAADMITQSLDKVQEAYDKGNNLSNKEMKDLFGINLPDKLEHTIEVDAKFTINEKEKTEQLKNLMSTLFRSAELGQLDDKTKREAGDRFMKGMEGLLEDGKISQGFYNKVQGIFDNMPSPSNAQAWTTFKASWSELVTALEQGDYTTAEQILSTISQDRASSINANAAGATAMSDAIAAISTKYGDLPTDEEIRSKAEALKNLAFGQPMTDIYSALGATPPTSQGGETPDTKGIDDAQTKLDNYKTALDGLPAVVATAVTNTNAEFDKLNPAGPGFQANVATFGTVLNTFPEATNLSVTNTNAEFDLLNPAGPGFQANVAVFGTVLNTMGPAAKVGVDAANVEFGLLGTTLKTVAVPAIETALDGINTGAFAKLQNNAAVTAQAVSNIFKTEAPKIKPPYDTAVSNIISGPFAKVQTGAATAAKAVTNIFNTEAPKLSTAYNGPINTVISKFGELQTKATSALSSIQTSANQAATAVGTLADEINALQDKTVTITTVQETVFTTRNAAAGFGPAVVDHPMQLMVGESGPEFVSVVPLSTAGGKNMTAGERLEAFADPRRERRPGDQPFQLTYMAEGNLPVGANRFVQSNSNVVDVRIVGVGNTYVNDALPVAGTEAGGALRISNVTNVNGQPGQAGSSANGTSTNNGSNIYTAGQSGANGGNGAGGDMSSTAIGQGSFGGGANRTSAAEQNSQPMMMSANATANGVPTTQTGSPGEGFEVSQGAQPNTANGPITVSPDNKIHLWDGSSYTRQEWNQLNDNARYNLAESDDVGIKSLPKNTFLEEDYSISQEPGGTTTQFVRNTTYQTGANAGQTSPAYQTPTGGAGGGGQQPQQGTGVGGWQGDPVPPHVKTSGSGSKWKGDVGSPSSWQVVPMTDSDKKGLYKVINSENGRNIAAEFTSEDEASSWLSTYTPMTGGGGGNQTPNNPPAGGTTVPGTVKAEDLEALKFGSSDTYASISAPENMTFQMTPQSTGWKYVGDETGVDRNSTPEDWFIKKQANGKFKVVTGDGKDVAIDFATVNDAQNFINYIIYDYARKNPGKSIGATTLPLFRDKNTGKVYSQDYAGNLRLQTGDFSDYTADPNAHAIPVTGQPDIVVPPPTGGGGGGGTTNPPPSGGGIGGQTGGTIPGYNGNFNYQINGRQLQITQGTITKNTLTAQDWPAADAAFFKYTGKHLPAFGSVGSGGGSGTGTGANGFVWVQDNTPFVNPASAQGTKVMTGSFEGGGWGGFTNSDRFVAPLQTTPIPGRPGSPGNNGGNNGGGGFPNFPNFPGFPAGFPFNDTGNPWDIINDVFAKVGLSPMTPNNTSSNTANATALSTNNNPQFLAQLAGTSSANNMMNMSDLFAGLGNGQNISRQWTDANGNNFNIQQDVNQSSNVNGVISTNTQGNTGGSSNSGLTPNSNVLTGDPAKIAAFITNYPKFAKTGYSIEPTHMPFRTGQDLSKPFFDTLGPMPHEAWAQYGGMPLLAGQTPWGPTGGITNGVGPGSPGSPGSPGGNGGIGGIGGWIGGIIDMVRDLISGIFSSINLNIFNQNILDTTKVYETQKRIFGLRQGTMIK